jgi:SAM-dependent methyltransferase
MRRDLVGCLACPVCRGPLEVAASRESHGEVETGTLTSRCGAVFSIADFVPSFFRAEALSDADRRMLADGEYWSGFYGFYDDAGYRYFIDSRTDPAPLLFQGILRRLSLGSRADLAHLHEPHYRDFFSPAAAGALPPGAVVFEAGCGSGWLTLELARQGCRAIGQDTARGALVRAKRQALAEGVAADYLHASSLALPLQSGTLDAFVGFQALHHFEALDQTLGRVNDALKPDAPVVIFEHRRPRPPKLHKIAVALERLSLPLIRRRFPPTGKADWMASPAEDTATADMDQTIRDAFAIAHEVSYSLFLQPVPAYAYFLSGERPGAFAVVARAVNAVDRQIARRWPDKCEHRLYLGRRRTTPVPPAGA